jgi:HEAT repeat protein
MFGEKAIHLVLGIINDTRAVEPLILDLEDEDYRVRLNAREALGEIGKRQMSRQP